MLCASLRAGMTTDTSGGEIGMRPAASVGEGSARGRRTMSTNASRSTSQGSARRRLTEGPWSATTHLQRRYVGEVAGVERPERCIPCECARRDGEVDLPPARTWQLLIQPGCDPSFVRSERERVGSGEELLLSRQLF